MQVADKTSEHDGSQRGLVADALLDSPDIESVVRLAIVEDAESQTLVIGATVAMVNTVPTHVISHALSDAKRRVREALGGDPDIFLEPDLVKDPSRDEPATDVIVIKASD